MLKNALNHTAKLALGHQKTGAPKDHNPAMPGYRRAGLASRKEEAVMLASPVIKGTEIKESVPTLTSKVPYCLP